MKHLTSFVAAILAFFFALSPAFAKSLPPHMDGLGLFTFKSSVGPAADKKAAREYAKDVKHKGFTYVMIKSHDGSSWGTKVGGKWMPAISKDLIDAFHGEGMRAYSYFTARTLKSASITKSVELAALTLDMGADGVIVDDLGLAGISPGNWEPLFTSLRKEVDKRRDKILASSTFPHMGAVKGHLWRSALMYSDFFLPQAYWMEFTAGKTHMTPENALAYAQGQFDSQLARIPESRCKLVPIGRTYGKGTTAKDVNRFLNAAMPYYAGAGLFVIEKAPKDGGWNAIRDTAKRYRANRSVKNISLIDAFRNPPKGDVKQKPNKIPKKGGKHNKKKIRNR